MTINWLEEAKKIEKELLADLSGWIQIPSVKEDSDNLVEYPVGKANREALDYFLALGKRDGYPTVNIDNIAGRIEFGGNGSLVGVLGHSDVVPVGDGWSQDPFSGAVEDGFMYGRGTQDDKGPMMAAYYALKLIQALELPLSKRVHLINGTDEESGFTCVERYFETEEMPEVGFSPDANFPLIYGEKGMVNFDVSITTNDDELLTFSSGQRLNMVPDEATATLQLDHSIEDAFNMYLNSNNYTGSYTTENGIQTVTIEGTSVHGMQPELGVNAAYLLVEFLNQQKIESNFLTLFTNLFLHDTTGEKLGVAHTGEMGGLTMNVGVVSLQNHKALITINLRHSQEWNQETGIVTITDRITSNGGTVEFHRLKTPLYVSPEDPFIQTLQGVYQSQTGDFDTPLLTTGGGTYASVMDKGVAYGMLFPGTEDRMHQLDERVPVEDLIKAVAIYAESIYELAK